MNPINKEKLKFINLIKNTPKTELQEYIASVINSITHLKGNTYKIFLDHTIFDKKTGKSELHIQPELKQIEFADLWPLKYFPELRRDAGYNSTKKINDLGLGTMFELKSYLTLIQEFDLTEQYKIRHSRDFRTPERDHHLAGIGLPPITTNINLYLNAFIEKSNQKGYNFLPAENYFKKT